MSVLYHPGKDNVVVDALSRMTICSVSHVGKEKKELVKYVNRLDLLGVQLKYSPNGGFMVHNNSDSSLVVEAKSKQHIDPLLIKFNESISQGGGWYS